MSPFRTLNWLTNSLSRLYVVQLDDFKYNEYYQNHYTYVYGGIVYKMLSRLNSISPRAVPGGVMPGVFSPVSLQSCVTSNWAGIKLSGSHVTCVLCSLHETLSRGALQPECRREYSGSLPLLCCISPPMFTMRSQWRWQWWRWWLVIMS